MQSKYLLLILGIVDFFSGNAQSYNLQQGIDAMKLSDDDKALDYLSRELKDNPKEAVAYFYRASVYNRKDQNASALSDINHAISFSHSKDKKWLPDAYCLRGNIHLKIQEYDKSFGDYNSALKIAPGNVNVYIDRAQVYIDLKQYRKAEVDYRRVLKIDEGEIRAWAGLGRNYFLEGQLGEAEKILDKLIGLSPGNSMAFYHRGFVRFGLKMYDEAISDLFQSIVLDETDADARSCFVSYAEKNYPLAISKVNKQMCLHTGNDFWYILRAQLFQGKGNYKAAINDYSKAVELADIDSKARVLALRAGSYSDAGMYDKAIADLSESISLDSLDAFTYAQRGNCKRLNGNYQGAIDDFTKASEIEPGESWFLYCRGWSYENTRSFDKAMSDYNDAISLDKSYAYTYLQRGRLYEQQFMDTLNARKDYSAILEYDTIINKEGNCRQYALFHLGKIEESVDWMNKILLEYPNEGNYYDATCLYSLIHEPKKAILNLELAFKNGYIGFNHLAADDDLNNIRQLPEFKALVEHWKAVRDDAVKADEKTNLILPDIIQGKASFPIKKRGSGVYEIPCTINDLALKMVFDTGASDISVSQTEVQFMLKNGYIGAEDIAGIQKYINAAGGIVTGTRIIFRKVDLGGIILRNVGASVINNKNAPLLFGQSALSKYGKIVIDNENKVITITTNNNSVKFAN